MELANIDVQDAHFEKLADPISMNAAELKAACEGMLWPS